MGPKFAIVFSGVDLEAVEEFMKTVKEKTEALKIAPAQDYNGEETEVSPKLNIALAKYYKGTALVGENCKYNGGNNKNENVINYL